MVPPSLHRKRIAAKRTGPLVLVEKRRLGTVDSLVANARIHRHNAGKHLERLPTRTGLIAIERVDEIVGVLRNALGIFLGNDVQRRRGVLTGRDAESPFSSSRRWFRISSFSKAALPALTISVEMSVTWDPSENAESSLPKALRLWQTASLVRIGPIQYTDVRMTPDDRRGFATK